MTKINIPRFDFGAWVLPAPENPLDKHKKEWERIPFIGVRSTVPFGYTVDPDDEDWLLPVPLELELLELAKEYKKRYSYRELAAWLTTQSGREISPEGLKVRLDSDKKRRKLAQIKRRYVKALQKALDQLETLEHQRLGAHKNPVYDD